MSPRNYALLVGVVASLSLLVAGCGSEGANKRLADPVTGTVMPAPARPPPPPAEAHEPDTEATIWTVLGLAKRPSEQAIGPQTGSTVSPVLWEAAHDALDFAGFSSEDSDTGLLVTQWYSPKGKPGERLRVSVFVLSRALRSDSISVSVEREEAAANGGWQETPVARDVVTSLENTILQRARQIHAERYRSTM